MSAFLLLLLNGSILALNVFLAVFNYGVNPVAFSINCVGIGISTGVVLFCLWWVASDFRRARRL